MENTFPTVAVSVSRQTMPVGGVSTTKCAVVLQLPALMKQIGFRSVAHGILCMDVVLVMAHFVLYTAYTCLLFLYGRFILYTAQ